ncbi:MAG: phosphoglycerate kinase, partial [Candidatus Berkiella sp.]
QTHPDHIKTAPTKVWTGPGGVFEFTPFAQGTQALAKAVANSSAFSVAGGGDTLAAIEQFNVTKGISYLSTGGGAFLEALEGITLPAVSILQERSKLIA